MSKRPHVWLEHLFPSPPALPKGMFSYQPGPDSALQARLHLRVEPDGAGLLIVNASTVLHLNPSACDIAYGLVQGLPDEQIAERLHQRYRIGRAEARSDSAAFIASLRELIAARDLDPELYLDVPRTPLSGGALSAPYRLDCALTYRLRDGDEQGLAPWGRVAQELDGASWRQILQTAWDAGVPHVVFTGGEPTLRDDLPELIAATQSTGQVSGLLTDGLRLNEEGYLGALLDAGLDHLLIALDPANPRAWDALQKALAEDIFLSVHLTLTAENAGELEEVLRRLSAMGVRSLSLSTTEPEGQEPLAALASRANYLGLSLTWDLPVPYSRFNPVRLELPPEERAEAVGTVLYVEPDGDVLPAQGINQPLGNLLRDPWETVWEHATAFRNALHPPAA
jgi:hypothetical protein